MPTNPTFNGSLDELKKLLVTCGINGTWDVLGDDHHRFKTLTKGILVWNSRTKSVSLQGQRAGIHELAKAIRSAPLAINDVRTDSINEQDQRVVARLNEPNIGADPAPSGDLLQEANRDGELVIALVGAVGTQLKKIDEILSERLKTHFGYDVHRIKISTDIIPNISDVSSNAGDEFDRIMKLMDAGNNARARTGDNSILALGAASKINENRPKVKDQSQPMKKTAFIISSLKHPAEVARLRQIYPNGFYMVGVHCDEVRRKEYLQDEKKVTDEQVAKLITRDEDEQMANGQRTSDTFHLSDFFVRHEADEDKLKHDLWRFLDILFGWPFATPTFDEYAMFMAFASSLRSADLSRQVGAVITRGNEIIATGANDCPKAGGGLYWPDYDSGKKAIIDCEGGRDYKRGVDSNKREQQRIVDNIVQDLGLKDDAAVAARDKLLKSPIRDLTEYGRVVHAEMEAILTCARNNVSCRNADLYCTTFPCHNCAKHIVAAGINRVSYIEPYKKSKAAEFHDDAISMGFGSPNLDLVRFEPFVGIGPRHFFDFFSMNLGLGGPIVRKNDDGEIAGWKAATAGLRVQMLPASYIDLEILAGKLFIKLGSKVSNGN